MKVLFCNKLKYPNGDAGSIRVERLAQMAVALGYDAFVVGLGHEQATAKPGNGRVPYISLRKQGDTLLHKLLTHILYQKGLRAAICEYKPDVIVMDDIGLLSALWLKAHCKSRRITLIHDSVEWYSPEQFPHGKLSLRYISKDILNQYLIDKRCKVIAISRYLFDYYQAKGIQTVRIPIVITDADLPEPRKDFGRKTVFTYAGQPGKKDFLHTMLEAFLLIPKGERASAVFNIVGCSGEQMIASGIKKEVLDELGETLVIHGRVSRDRVLEILKETDFTLLVRDPEQRYAKAGFPSKVVESLANATPVLCNYSSDLELYLKDGENAIIAENHSARAVSEAIRRAIEIPSEGRYKMSKAAAESAEQYFDYRRYLGELNDLLKN